MTELVQNPPRGTSCSAREAARAESAARPWPKTRTPGGPQNGGVWAGSCQEGGHQGTLCPGRAGWDFSSLALEPTGAPSTHCPPPLPPIWELVHHLPISFLILFRELVVLVPVLPRDTVWGVLPTTLQPHPKTFPASHAPPPGLTASVAQHYHFIIL